MPATTLAVTLLAHTPQPLSLIYAAFRQCYHPGDVADLWPRLLSGEIAQEKQADFVARILASGHESPIEHVSFSFAVSGVSRALTHQLVRHRLASYSQQSQRYVDATRFDYVLPPAIAAIPEAKAAFEAAMDQAGAAYAAIQDILSRHGRAGQANEDARFVLPNACQTRIVVTMNCRSLLHFFELRCCMRAQWEIRALALEMLALCRQALPVIFAGAGARCERLGYCPEDERFTCGRFPLRPGSPPISA
jgi:thymidylate synthase (FAD)